MNKKLKDALKDSFEAPMPVKKEEFLRGIQMPPISSFAFVCSQAAYIHKWIWALSIMIFSIALIGAEFLEKNMLWHISSFMPLLALTIITESGRSETFGMAEFELSARFSLKSVVLARLGILGIANLILICMLVPLAIRNSETTILQTGIYLICPYLLTVFLGLWVVRKTRGKETIYLCTGIAASVSFGNMILYPFFPFIFGEHLFIWWVAASVILGIGVANQCYQVIKQTEELAWNL
ncbi:MAG: hypothetical protein NC318_14195 [Blautia sp.]|nr:hypothetical protein [Lachnoclostridium sp.]MCM1212733.1 hypothetical protein [Blautia sp.]